MPRAQLCCGEERARMSTARDAGLGLKSEELRAALKEALGGRETRLSDLLARHGGLPGPRPNFALAAAFGDAVAQEGKGARRVLSAFAASDAKADSAHVFLPIAAAFGYVARIESDPADAWSQIFELTADDRGPSRIGLITALSDWARVPGRVDELLTHAEAWLEHEDREHRNAASAIALDVIADRQVLLSVRDRE